MMKLERCMKKIGSTDGKGHGELSSGDLVEIPKISEAPDESFFGLINWVEFNIP